MKKRILVVDDEKDFRDLIICHLEDKDHEILTATCGMEALTQARRHLPDLILLDLMLPDLDGFEVCDLLRKQPSTLDIPIILITAMASEVVRTNRLAAGADRCLAKPVRREALRSCVRQVLQELDARREADLASPEGYLHELQRY